MEAAMRERPEQQADWEPANIAPQALRSVEAANRPDQAPEPEVARFAGQTMTKERAAQIAFQASSEGMGV